MMRKCFVMFSICTLLSIMLCFDTAAARPTADDGLQDELTSFFVDYLKGKTGAEAPALPVRYNDIEKYREMVWLAWSNANDLLQEEKLIPLDSLSLGNNDKWNLPDSLEPHAVMPYYWGTKGERPYDGYPLYLYLHGSGPKSAEWATGLKLCNYFDDAPSVYFIPQIPNEGEYYRWWQRAKLYAWDKLLRLAFLSKEIDANRVYLFGISEGGYGSQRLASYYADYLAGAGPMAGGEPLVNAPAENCANIAFSFLTGANDRMFERNRLTHITKEAFDTLQSLHPNHYTHRIELIEGMGHGIDYARTTVWLKNFTRNPYPKYVNWESFPIDGAYRKGFYNLVPLEQPKDDTSRLHYEMSVEGNEIDLRVDVVTYKTAQQSEQWGFPIRYEKCCQKAKRVKLLVYLNDSLVDLKKRVVLRVNGKRIFKGKLKADVKHLAKSCATFFDSERLYPAAIRVDFEDME